MSNMPTKDQLAGQAGAVSVPGSGGTELFYTLHETIFGAVAKQMVALGWSVYPQTMERRPALCNGAAINWQKDYDLTNSLPSERTVALWSMHCATANVALVCGPVSGTWALDIDITDEAISDRVEALADEILGWTPFRRVGNAPKIALLYQQVEGAETLIGNDIVRFEGGSDHAIDILAHGKSITLHGRHHRTGGYFKWLDGGKSPLTLPPTAAPQVSAAKLEEFLAALDAKFPIRKPGVRTGTADTGDASGIRTGAGPENDPALIIDGEGRVIDGRFRWMGKVGWGVVLRQREAVLEAKANRTLPKLRDDLTAAAVQRFQETADCRGDRWGNAENLADEARTAVESAVAKALNGKMTSHPKAQAPVEVAADQAFDPVEMEKRMIVADLLALAPAKAQASREAYERRMLAEGINPVTGGDIEQEKATRQAKAEAKATAKAEEAAEPEVPYIPLGNGKGFYHYITTSGEYRKLSENDLTSQVKLLLLQDYDAWREAFPGPKGAIHTMRAAEHLMRESENVGLFTPSRVRGRGLWFDEGRTVLHMGDRLLVDGVSMNPRRIKSKFIYSLAETYENLEVGTPLTDAEGEMFVRMLQEVSWISNKKPTGLLFAGWLMTAAVCGGLDWRTHAYLAAGRGSGKGWLLSNVVRPILAAQALSVKSKTSEAAIRRSLGADARPVIFDEFETQNAKDRTDKQQVLDLARAASEEDETSIIKASTEGDGVMMFKIRSSFLFVSIQVALSQAADESRTVIFEIRQPTDVKERHAGFDRCSALHQQVMTNDFAARFLSRALQMLPAIRESHKIFKRALTRLGREDRTGDTYGTAIAGAWCLTHSKAPTDAEAAEFVKDNGWGQAAAQAEDTAEWRRALDYLMQQRVFVKAHNNTYATDYQVGQIVDHLVGLGDGSVPDTTPSTVLRRALGEFGIRVDGEGAEATVTVANSSAPITAAFEKTDWSGKAWIITLGTAPGATKPPKPQKFASLASRGTAIPHLVFVGEKND